MPKAPKAVYRAGSLPHVGFKCEHPRCNQPARFEIEKAPEAQGAMLSKNGCLEGVDNQIPERKKLCRSHAFALALRKGFELPRDEFAGQAADVFAEPARLEPAAVKAPSKRYACTKCGSISPLSFPFYSKCGCSPESTWRKVRETGW